MKCYIFFLLLLDIQSNNACGLAPPKMIGEFFFERCRTGYSIAFIADSELHVIDPPNINPARPARKIDKVAQCICQYCSKREWKDLDDNDKR